MKLLWLIFILVLVTVVTALLSTRFRALLKRVRHLFWVTLKRSVLPAVVAVVGMFIVFFADLLAESTAGVDRLLKEIVQLFARSEVHALLKAGFFEEVGIAFIVSGLIAFMVEFNFHSREQHKAAQERAEIAKSVFNYLLGSLAPPWLTLKVADLYKMKLLREDIVVTYTFEDPPKEVARLYPHREPDVHDLLVVIVELRYRLRNLTDEQIPVDISHGFTPSVPLPAKYTGFTDLLISDNKHNPIKQWREGSRDETIHCPVASDEDRLGWKEREIRVRDDLFIDPKDTLNVVVKLRAVRWRNDHATWVTRLPADHIRVVVVNDKCTDIEFLLDAAHPKPFKQTPSVWEWESTGESIPFQGFTLHWFPSPKEHAPHPQSQSAQVINSA
jgi:hypothetical protein